MKCIRVSAFGGPEVLQVKDVTEPQPVAGQILVRLRAAGVNPVETYIRAGKYPKLPEPPYTPGAEGAGVVEALGPEVSKFRVGDRVFLSGSVTGTYAELAVCTVAMLSVSSPNPIAPSRAPVP